MLIEEKEYESGSYDREEEYNVLIASVSSSLIIDNLLDQIEDLDNVETLKARNSIFEPLKDRINYLLKKYPAGTEEYQEVYETINNTLELISDKIEEKIGINIEYSDVLDLGQKILKVSALYYFFVVNLEKNLETFIVNYIYENRDMYKLKMSAEEQRNNSFNYIKKFIDNEYSCTIFKIRQIIEELELPKLVNEDVLDYIISEEPEELINFIIEDMLIENQWVEVDHIRPLSEFFQSLTVDNEILIQSVKFKLAEKLR